MANFFFGDQLRSLKNNSVSFQWDSSGKLGEAFGVTEHAGSGKLLVTINPSFLSDQTGLYLTLGHELVHVEDIDNGNEAIWFRTAQLYGNMKLLPALMEYHAYQWSAQAEYGFDAAYNQQGMYKYYQNILPQETRTSLGYPY